MDPHFTSDVACRARAPVGRFFEALGRGEPECRTDEFFLWLRERDLPARFGSVRQFLKGLLGLFAESTLALTHPAR
jgi:hypothetical protein